MFKKNTALFVLFFLSIIPMKSHSSNGEKFVEMQLNNRIGLIELQARNVLGYQKDLGSDRLSLVLGAMVSGADELQPDNHAPEKMSKRFSEEYIFADIEHKMPQNTRAITLDFNNLEELKVLSQSLAGRFDSIVLDGSTYKFTQWSTSHMTFFKELLKPGGQFIFAPVWRPDHQEGAFSTEAWLQNLKENLDFSVEHIIRLIPMPRMLTLAEGDIEKYRTEIDAVKNKYAEMESKNLSEKARRLFSARNNFSLIQDYSALADNKRDLRIFLSIGQKLFLKEFKRDVMIPQNLTPVVEEAFGAGSVKISYDQPLPFPNNYAHNFAYLVTATK